MQPKGISRDGTVGPEPSANLIMNAMVQNSKDGIVLSRCCTDNIFLRLWLAITNNLHCRNQMCSQALIEQAATGHSPRRHPRAQARTRINMAALEIQVDRHKRGWQLPLMRGNAASPLRTCCNRRSKTAPPAGGRPTSFSPLQESPNRLSHNEMRFGVVNFPGKEPARQHAPRRKQSGRDRTGRGVGSSWLSPCLSSRGSGPGRNGLPRNALPPRHKQQPRSRFDRGPSRSRSKLFLGFEIWLPRLNGFWNTQLVRF